MCRRRIRAGEILGYYGANGVHWESSVLTALLAVNRAFWGDVVFYSTTGIHRDLPE